MNNAAAWGARTIRTVFTFISAVARMLLGSWSAPAWMHALGRAGGRTASAIAAKPLHATAIVALIAATTAGGVYGYRWYQARPKPVEATISVTDPSRTEIENEREPNPLTVAFSQSVAPLGMADKEVTQGIRIEPTLAGAWRWKNDQTLEFRPKEDWPVGAQYSVKLDKEVVAPQVVLSDTRFKFSAAPFKAAVERAQFYQEPTNPALKKAIFELRFSHPVNGPDLEKRISLQLAGQSEGMWGLGRETTRFTVSYDKLKLHAYIHSEPLPMPQEDSAIAFKLAKGAVAERGGAAFDGELSQSVRVPGLASLAVRELSAGIAQNAKNEPEQILTVTLSASTYEKDIKGAISAWVLPLNHPKQEAKKTSYPYSWSNPAEITEEILKTSTKLDLDLAPGEREHAEFHALRYSAPIGRYVYVQVERGLKSFGGYTLAKRAQTIAQVPPFPSQLNIVGQGALVSMSGDKKVALLVRDLPGVKMEISRVLPAQLQHIVSQSGGDFSNPQWSGNVGPDNLTERFEKKIPLALKSGKTHYEALNLAEYLGKDASERRGIFLLKVQGWNPAYEPSAQPVNPQQEPEPQEEGEGNGDGMTMQTDQQDASERQDTRLLLVTDLGVLVKRSLDGTQDVFVQSIANGQPVAGATVDVIAKNGLAVFSQQTDATGRATFPKLDGLTRERAPLLYLVRKGGDMSFLPLNRSDRGLDVSRFDVGGIRNTVHPGKLSAYLFSDRGMYRPGDALHIGFIVKSANWGRALAGLPLEAEVLDPRGLVVKRQKLRLTAGGFGEIEHTTLETSPTGLYNINLYLAHEDQATDSLGSVAVKVQEFLPDRMKVSARLSTDATEGWVHPKELKANVNVQNLFGTPAQNRRVEATLTLQPAFPAFASHPDFKFYDPARAKDGYSNKLADGTTNEAGDVAFDLGLDRYAQATYRLHMLARAFEPEGGRSVTAEVASLISERNFLVGYKPDGDLNFVSRGAKRTATLIAIDPKAKKIAAEDLKLELVERRFVSVLVKQPNDTYKYQSRPKEIPVSEKPISIPATGLTLALDSSNPGTFFYRVRDAAGLELNRVEYSVAGAGNVTRSLDRNAELQLTLNKKSYAPGEDIEVSIRAPYTGAGLITIERDKVYAYQWFKSDTQASVQKIKVPAGFEGGGYVSVQFVRDAASDEIFMSPLAYGVVPFAVDLDRRTNTLALSAPTKVKPGDTLKMKLKAAQPTRAVVFAVDEGILQVARYSNPDPLGFFFQKRSLDVRTSQILDQILPEFRKLMQAAAPGGDGESALGKNLNPFKRKREKPAVYWSGIVDVKGETEFTYVVPDTFNGSLRLIAVAVNEQTIGVTQSRATVQGDFVLLPNAPLAVAPGDTFDVSVGVANNVAGSGTDTPVSATIKVSPHLEVVGEATQALKVGALREGVAIFKVKAKAGADSLLGSATLTFGARFADGKTAGSAKLATDVSVRPASPYTTLVTVGSFKGSVEVPIKRVLEPNYRTTEAALSPIPLVIASGLTTYLNNFPHLCTEQLVSRALPGIVLAKRPEFGRSKDAPVSTKPFDSALTTLRARQNAEGGFGQWTASVEADEYASVYAAHMLLEARERGLSVPDDMLSRSNGYLNQLAASPARDLHDVRARVYAAYLLARQGTVVTGYLATQRETLDKKYAKDWQNDSIATLLAATYKLMKDERAANTLLDSPLEALAKVGEPYRYERYYDPLIRNAQTLYLAARHFPERTKTLPEAALETMVRAVQTGHYNTHSAAFVVLALDAYATQVDGQLAGKLGITQIAADGKEQALPLPQNLIPRVPFTETASKLRFTNEAPLTTFYAVAESGFDKVPPTTELKSGMEVIREYVDAAGKPVTKVKVGEEITVRLSFRAINRPAIPNVALVDLLPGGFEPVLQPVDAPEVQSSKTKGGWVNRLGNVGGWNVDYADVREERVVLYGTVTSNTSEYRYRIRATNTGTFVVPPAYGESLYEREVQARTAAGTITVERAGK